MDQLLCFDAIALSGVSFLSSTHFLSLMSLATDLKVFIRRITGREQRKIERWNREYAEGKWAWLRRLDELAHHSVLAGYFMEIKPQGTVLDVGCGEGLLQERITPFHYSKYMGTDLDKAIEIASKKNDEKTHFVVGDMNTFNPGESFDAIIFNESIYYLHDTVGGLQRYEEFLKPDGIFIISMFQSEKNIATKQRIQEKYTTLDEVTITNTKGTTWMCFALSRA